MIHEQFMLKIKTRIANELLLGRGKKYRNVHKHTSSMPDSTTFAAWEPSSQLGDESSAYSQKHRIKSLKKQELSVQSKYL